MVHQQDVQSVVNALWAGGAEAMMIMDQRVLTTSAVRCIGNTLLLQGRTYSPPFVVTAIGDAARMSAALDADTGRPAVLHYVEKYGLVYEVTVAGPSPCPPTTASAWPAHQEPRAEEPVTHATTPSARRRRARSRRASPPQKRTRR